MWYFLPVYCSLGANLPPPPDLISIGEYFGKCWVFLGNITGGNFIPKSANVDTFSPRKVQILNSCSPKKV